MQGSINVGAEAFSSGFVWSVLMVTGSLVSSSSSSSLSLASSGPTNVFCKLVFVDSLCKKSCVGGCWVGNVIIVAALVKIRTGGFRVGQYGSYPISLSSSRVGSSFSRLHWVNHKKQGR